MMKKLLLSMSALAAVAGAAPAVAQYNYDYPQRNYSDYSGRTGARAWSNVDFRDRIHRLELRLDAGIRSGDITRSEGMQLRRQLISLRQLERQYSYNGLSMRERDYLMTQIRAVRQNINFADNGRWDRDNRYSWYDNELRGSGGPIEMVDACADRGGAGLSGVFNNVFGRSCLRVGDLATRNMFAVPFAYRNQYRDTADVYHRYDGNLVYAIDPITNRVIASWDVD